jgi:SPW repeat
MLLDGIKLLLGAALAASAWVIGFVSEPAASWNAWLSGLIVAVLAAAGLLAFAEWTVWLTLTIGLWVAASPWVISFSANEIAMWLHLMVGLIVGALAMVQIWRAHRTRRGSPPDSGVADHVSGSSLALRASGHLEPTRAENISSGRGEPIGGRRWAHQGDSDPIIVRLKVLREAVTQAHLAAMKRAEETRRLIESSERLIHKSHLLICRFRPPRNLN